MDELRCDEIQVFIMTLNNCLATRLTGEESLRKDYQLTIEIIFLENGAFEVVVEPPSVILEV